MANLPVRAPGGEPGEVIPFSRGDEIFAVHRRRAGIAGNLLVALAGVGAGVLVAVGGGAFGLVGALASAALGLGGVAATTNVAALLGNGSLEERLRAHIGVADASDLEFVGLCDGGNNTVKTKILTPHLETDDNVGFLALEDDCLRLHLEDTTLFIPREEIRQITTERVVELPILTWIRIQFYEGSARSSFLVMSRRGQTLRDLRRATASLHDRLVEWYLDDKLAALEGLDEDDLPAID